MFCAELIVFVFEVFDLEEWKPILKAWRIVADESDLPAEVISRFKELRK